MPQSLPTDVEAATQATLRLLKARARSRAELEQALSRKGHPPELIAQVLERLAGWGYLNDAAFARQRAAAFLRAGQGPGAIRRKLAAQGIDEVGARDALAAAQRDEGFDEAVAARALIARRRAQGAQAVRLLVSRGFSRTTIETVTGTSTLDWPPEDE